MNNFESGLIQKANYINDELKYIFEHRKDKFPETLYNACTYSIFSGGKRLRPIILTQAHIMMDGNIEKSITLGCAVEMIHTATLVHDDLPAMDDDDLRRGKLTLHKVFGEAIAILAGMELFNFAYDIMHRGAIFCKDNQAGYLEAIAIISNSIGEDGVIGGQVVDIESEGKSVGADVLEYIHTRKTGALLKSCLMAGVILEDADAKYLQVVKSYGDDIGLAFQIADDILDVIGDEAKMGKPIGSDAGNDKSTYVMRYGIDKARRMAVELADKAADEIVVFGKSSEFFKQLAYFIIERDN